MSNLIAALFLTTSGALPPGDAALAPGGPSTPARLPVLEASVSALSPGDPKCSGRPGSHPDLPETVVIVDDRLIEVEIPDFDLDDHGLENSDIHSFGFVCWQWIEEYHGVRVQSTGVYMVTVDWMKRRQANQLAALEAVIAAQDRYRERHGKYAHQSADLPGFDSLADYGLPSYFELDLIATDDGWGALVRATIGWSDGVEYGAPTGCAAFAGAVPETWKASLREEGQGLRERQPVCSRAPTG